MKKILLIPAFAIALLNLTSCDSEPLDPVISQNQPDNGNNNGGGGNNGGTDNGTSEGDYWPLAVNNEWKFEATGNVEGSNDPMKIIGTETINGKLYYKMNYAFQDAGTDDMTGTAVMYVIKEGGTYKQRVSVDVPNQEGVSITVSPYEVTLLKDNLAVGEGWTENVTQTTSYEVAGMPNVMPDVQLNLSLNGTIEEKGTSIVVNGVTYNNVIKVKVVQVATTAMQGFPAASITTTSYLWFAKDIGPVKSEATGPGMNYQQNLIAYTLN